MKKLILIVILVLALTTSVFAWVPGVFDLTPYNDTHEDFLNFLKNMPDIYNMHLWMEDNFIRVDHDPYYTPYQQWVYKTTGDCNDMSTFVLYYLKVHFYCKYKQVYIKLSNGKAHMLAVEPYGIWYTSNQGLYASFDSIAECVADYDESVSASVLWYNVYDYDLNFIESSKSPAGVPDVPPTSCLE